MSPDFSTEGLLRGQGIYFQKADSVGHDFHGNQWTQGTGDGRAKSPQSTVPGRWAASNRFQANTLSNMRSAIAPLSWPPKVRTTDDWKNNPTNLS